MMGGEVLGAWACPRCGASDVDTLRLEDPADDDQDPEREVVVCERCGLRYRLP
jgi:transcription elongation factor Elf1